MDLLGYRPFIDPIDVVGWQKMLLMLPLCLAISIVYKTTKCDELREVPVAAIVLWITIVAGMFAVGIGLFAAFTLLA